MYASDMCQVVRRCQKAGEVAKLEKTAMKRKKAQVHVAIRENERAGRWGKTEEGSGEYEKLSFVEKGAEKREKQEFTVGVKVQ